MPMKTTVADTQWAEAQDSGAKTTTVIDFSALVTAETAAAGDRIVVRSFNLSGDTNVTSATLQFTTSAKVVGKIFANGNLAQSGLSVKGAANEDLDLVTVGTGAYSVAVGYDIQKA